MALKVNLDDFDQAEFVFDGLAYNGLDLNAIRKKFLLVYPEKADAIQAVILCLIAYSKAGNNLDKLTKKVVSSETGNNVRSSLRSLKVKQKANLPDDLTMPRVALAFLPPYLLLRRVFSSKMQNQTKSAISVVYKDPVFNGVALINSIQGYSEYYDEFSKMINQTASDGQGRAKRRRIDDDEEEEMAGRNWKEIAERGYESDVKIHPMMVNAMTHTDPTFETVKSSVKEILKMTHKMMIGNQDTSKMDEDDMMDEWDSDEEDEPGQMDTRKPAAKSKKPTK